MKEFNVLTSSPYNIYIGEEVLKDCGTFVSKVLPKCKVCLITDSNVNSLYAQVVMSSLMENGYQTTKVVFPAGEHSKNLTTYGNILSALAEEGLTRSDAIISLGGGVVSDIAGFVAATYMRGIPYIQIPTTLLSAMDATVGGKTGLNLNSGKNLVGAFWQPSQVIIDVKTFASLSQQSLLDGLAEALKSAVTTDKTLLQHIREKDYTYVISRCISIRKSLVEVDERDQGVRHLLNFGHTIGHGIEKCSAFDVTHGQAIVKGMIAEAKGAYKMGYAPVDISGQLLEIFGSLGFDTDIRYNYETIYNLSLIDKKIEQGEITIITPEALGLCTLKKIPLSKLRDFINNCLN